jgi:hypothetical protein
MLDTGEVPEWLIGAVSKTVVALTGYRGFESHPLRRAMPGYQPGIFSYRRAERSELVCHCLLPQSYPGSDRQACGAEPKQTCD